jgi:hypothetical protein
MLFSTREATMPVGVFFVVAKLCFKQLTGFYLMVDGQMKVTMKVTTHNMVLTALIF